MPRVAMTVTDISRTGVVVPAEQTVDVAQGNYVPNDGRVVLLIKNAGATTRNLTVAVNRTVDGQTVAARSYALTASQSKYIGPFDTSTYGTELNINGDHADVRVTPLRVNL